MRVKQYNKLKNFLYEESMNNNGFNCFDDMFKACGFDNKKGEFDFQGNDIFGGFQKTNPECFAAIAEILGHFMAGNMPFNVQNAVGNWFELIGQIIITRNAQQQYFQGGPGRYFDYKNYNVSNPFSPQTSGFTEGNTSSGESEADEEEEEDEDNENMDSAYKKQNKEMIELKKRVADLSKELESITKKLNNINKK